MLDKLLQAAIITFLLYLIAGLNTNTTSQTKASLPQGIASTPIARLLISSR